MKIQVSRAMPAGQSGSVIILDWKPKRLSLGPDVQRCKNSDRNKENKSSSDLDEHSTWAR